MIINLCYCAVFGGGTVKVELKKVPTLEERQVETKNTVFFIWTFPTQGFAAGDSFMIKIGQTYKKPILKWYVG